MQEDFAPFFADFGVLACFRGEVGKVMFDAPESVTAGGMVISADYAITYPTGLFAGLAHEEKITVDGERYEVNSVQAIEDGKLMMASLSKL